MYLRHGRDYIDLEEQDDYGRTPLLQMLGEPQFYFDIEDDIFRKLQILLDHGADIDGRDDEGRTCLHTVLHNFTMISFPSVMKVLTYLIRMGADVHAVDNKGVSVTEHAHLRRVGRKWEEALKECELDVQEVYTRDCHHGTASSDDIYAPYGGRPRLVHTLGRAYYDIKMDPKSVDVLLLEPLRQAQLRAVDLYGSEHFEPGEQSSDFSDYDEESQNPDYDITNGGNEDTPLNPEDINKDNENLSGSETDDAAQCSDSDDDTGGVPIVC